MALAFFFSCYATPGLCSADCQIDMETLVLAQPQPKDLESDRSHTTRQIMPPKGKGKKGKKDVDEEYWYATHAIPAEKSNDDMRC